MAAKTFTTKPFLIATAGSTVDGRTIDDKQLKELASSYDPKTYGARVNIEHIRGVSGSAPFNAYGDLLALTTGEVDVNFNGKTEKRTALYGTFELNESAKALNDAGQKVYPSIEIQDNFGGKGFAYCMGVALTDSPAAIATQRMQFNRTDPGRLNVSSDEAALLEFVEEATGEANPAMDGFFSKLGDLLKPFAAKTAPVVVDPAKAADPAAFDMAAFTTVMEGMAKQFDSSLSAIQLASTKQLELVQAEVTSLAQQIETTAAPGHAARPLGVGSGGNFATTNFV